MRPDPAISGPVPDRFPTLAKYLKSLDVDKPVREPVPVSRNRWEPEPIGRSEVSASCGVLSFVPVPTVGNRPPVPRDRFPPPLGGNPGTGWPEPGEIGRGQR